VSLHGWDEPCYIGKKTNHTHKYYIVREIFLHILWNIGLNLIKSFQIPIECPPP
jgi:hypothetical protein